MTPLWQLHWNTVYDSYTETLSDSYTVTPLWQSYCHTIMTVILWHCLWHHGRMQKNNTLKTIYEKNNTFTDRHKKYVEEICWVQLWVCFTLSVGLAGDKRSWPSTLWPCHQTQPRTGYTCLLSCDSQVTKPHYKPCDDDPGRGKIMLNGYSQTSIIQPLKKDALTQPICGPIYFTFEWLVKFIRIIPLSGIQLVQYLL